MPSLNALNKNIELKNCNIGKPCFIIGNGPSINNQDIISVKNETTIVTNMFFKHPNCKELSPNYWVCADPDFWLKQDVYLEPLLTAIDAMELHTKLFFPLHGSTCIRWSPFINMHFFNYDHTNIHANTIDFSKSIPPFGQNVIIVSIMLALYLGSNPIYLLGCDHTWWGWSHQQYASEEIPHFYKVDQSTVHDNMPYEQLQTTIRIQKYQYLELLRYAQQRGVSIINATHGGNLEIFPRISFENIKPTSPVTPRTSFVLKNISNINQQLTEAAIDLIKQDRYGAALAMIKEATKHNINHLYRINGLKYLEALCLLKLGEYDSALDAAREDFALNPNNRTESSKLINQLGFEIPDNRQQHCTLGPLS